jgi:hypothetical protein
LEETNILLERRELKWIIKSNKNSVDVAVVAVVAVAVAFAIVTIATAFVVVAVVAVGVSDVVSIIVGDLKKHPIGAEDVQRSLSPWDGL